VKLRNLKRLAALSAAFAALVPLAASANASVPIAGFTDGAVVSGLDLPTAVAFLPDGRMLVTQKGGRLLIVNGSSATPLIDLQVCDGAEMGLLGVAVDPAFDSNGFIYLYRTRPGTGGGECDAGNPERVNQIVRVQLAGGAVDPGSLQVLVDQIKTDNGNHNGGALRIGPDGKLYASVGDTGLGGGSAPGSSTNPYAQSLSDLEGKVLRVELSGAPAAGNPFIGVPGARGEIFALGFRNPFRFGFDPLTGRLWLGDVGAGSLEELDIVHAGGNYSWPHCEGTLPAGCIQPGEVAPVFEYPHGGSTALGRTIIGGSFADFGAGLDYFFADFISDTIYRAIPTAGRDGIAAAPSVLVSDASTPVDVVTGPDGALYYVSLGGEVRRVTGQFPNTAAPSPAPGDRSAPVQRVKRRRVQDIDRLVVRVMLNEAGTIRAAGSISTPGSSLSRRFRTVRRSLAANAWSRLRLKLRKRSLRPAKRRLRAGKRLRARIDLTALDKAGNSSRKRVTIRVTDRRKKRR
jgi:glucose/arabinose dehydrogenase